MLPEDYRIYAIWESIRSRKRDAGKLQVLINKEVTKRQLRIYEANLTLLNDMAKSVAKRANDYSACDDSEYIFGHGEWQLNSILIPAFWDIVGKRRGSVLVQCPTGRKRAKDPLDNIRGGIRDG